MKKLDHGKKWMPAMYVAYFGVFQDIANNHGYALCVHGSVVRDFDIIAVPFDVKVSPHEDLLNDIRLVIGFGKSSKEIFDKVGYEPHGRFCYTLECGAGGFIDISFTPTIEQAKQKVKDDIQKDKEIKKMLNRMKKVQASDTTMFNSSTKAKYKTTL